MADDSRRFILCEKYDQTNLVRDVPTMFDSDEIFAIEGFKDVQGELHAAVTVNCAPAPFFVFETPTQVFEKILARGKA